MFKITAFQRADGSYAGFEAFDHASYEEEGHDIVCSAVSALVFNCINSIDTFTDADYQCDTDEKDARILFHLNGTTEKNAQLLISSLLLGIQNIEEEYPDYVDLIIKEV